MLLQLFHVSRDGHVSDQGTPQAGLDETILDLKTYLLSSSLFRAQFNTIAREQLRVIFAGQLVADSCKFELLNA